MKILEAYKEFSDNYLLIRQYSPVTVDGYWWVIKSFIEFTGNIEVEKITIELLNAWIRYTQDKGNTKSTVATNIARMRIFIHYLNLAGYTTIRKESLALPKIPRHLPEYVTLEQVNRMIDFAPSLRDKTIVSMFFSTGMRNSELRSLLKGQVSSKNIVIKEGKGMRDRMCYMDDRTRNFLDRYLNSRVDSSPFVFVTNENRQIASSTMRYIITNVARHAGLSHITPHQFRHGLATHLMKQGMPTRMIQKILGHQNLQTTEMYLHVTDREMSKKYESIMESR